MTMISSWSHSKLTDFEKCKFLAWLKHDQRIPEPERELRPGQSEHANDRGTRIHTHAELFIRGQVPHQIPEMAEFNAEFLQLRHLFELGRVSLEGEWAVDRDWNPTDWRTGWHRSKVDAMVFLDDKRAVVIDYKSGKRWGNELKHGEQTNLYALNAILRYPDLEEVTTELWYLDVKELTSTTYDREKILSFKPSFTRRGTAITTCTKFPPNPNIHSCQWCQYGPWNGGQCTVGVRR